MITYGNSTLPGDSATVRERETTAVSRGFDASVAIVGGYDASNGDLASEDVGTAVAVSGGSEAATVFGEGSELHRQTQLAYANGADTVYGVAVPETTGESESFSASSSGTLSEAPVFDPNVQPEHEIIVEDTTASVELDVEIVYDDSPSQPSESDVAAVNPANGEWAADQSADYDVTYDYGTYDSADDGDTPIEAATKTNPRIVAVCTEVEDVVDSADSDVVDRATDFDFMHAIGGAGPEVGTPADYEDSIESRWTCVVPHARGYFDNDAQPEVRTLGAIAGAVAGSELTASTTTVPLDGIASLRTNHTPTEVASFGDAEYDDDNHIQGVMPLIDRGEVEIVEDLTSDPDGDFRSLYKHEIVNDLAYSIHLVARDFVREPNTENSREQDLLVPTENLLRSAAEQSPPMLHNPTDPEADPFVVDVGIGSADDTATLTVGLDPLDVTKYVEVEIDVGDVVTFGGTSS